MTKYSPTGILLLHNSNDYWHLIWCRFVL